MERVTRLRGTGLRLAGAALAAAVCLALGAQPSFARKPLRPAFTWPTARLYGVNYVDLREVAQRYGYRARWSREDEGMRLEGPGEPLEFEKSDRDFHIGGIRVFMSEPVVAARGSLWVAQTDLIKMITPIVQPDDLARFLPDPPKLIVLDAGHGGSDPGKQNHRLNLDEKDMTLDVVLRLQKLLESRGYRVVLTRKDDSKLAQHQEADLQMRAAVGTKVQADLFISVHFNAVDPKDADRVSGSETYVMTPQYQISTAAGQKDSMTDTYFPGNRQDTANALLGYCLHRQLITDLKTSDRGFKRGRLYVLRFSDCPAALVEAAYLSNEAEARRVGTPEFRQSIAEAIAQGVQSYADKLGAL